jgi:hypothetical protein
MADPLSEAFGALSAPSAPSIDPLSAAFSHMQTPDDPLVSAYKAIQPEEQKPLVPDTPPPDTDEGGDGFWSTLGGAAQKGMSEGWTATKALAQATGRKLSGGDFFQDQPPDPEVNDEATKVLNEPWSADNLWSPKKWAATIVREATASWPELGAGAIGGLVGGPLGAAGGFALGTGLESLLPNYQQARAQGLDHDSALMPSLKATGVDTAAAGLMGLVPEMGLGIDAIKRPITDAMVKMGLVQPALGVGGLVAHAGVTGQDISPDDIMNTAVGAAGLGIGLTGVHALGLSTVRGRALNAPATEGGIQGAFDATRPPVESQPVIVRAPEVLMSEAPIQGEVLPPDRAGPTFFSRVQRVIDEKGPESASPQQWLSTIRNAPGVKAEEIESLNLPQWLADRNGNVSKTDLLAHVEENQVRVEESEATAEPTPNGAALQTPTDVQYGLYRLPGPIAKYGELKFYLPPKEGDVLYEAPHFGEENTNLLAHTRYTDRIDRDGFRTLFIEEMQSDWHQTGQKEGYAGKDIVDPKMANLQDKSVAGVPDAPFKTSWPDLTFKRMMRYAADNGFQRIAWTNGDQQVARYPGLSEKAQGGLREFYDKRVPRIADGWAKRLGMDRGETSMQQDLTITRALTTDPLDLVRRFSSPERLSVRYIDVSPAAATRIRMGLPLFSERNIIRVSPVPKDSMVRLSPQIMPKISAIFGELTKRMGIEAPIRLEWYKGGVRGDQTRVARGLVARDASGYTIRVNLAEHQTPEEVYSTIAHEFGHVVMWDKFDNAPDSAVSRIEGAYRKFLAGRGQDQTYKQLLQVRDNAVSNFYLHDKLSEIPVLSMTPERQKYWSGFEEWFAEQTARWATTQSKPMSIVDRFFASLGERVRAAVAGFREKIGIPYEGVPSIEMKQWLDSMVKDVQPFGADRVAIGQWRTAQQSQRSFERDGTPEVQAVPHQLGTQTIRDSMARIMKEGVPPDAGATAAHADRINKAYEWLTSLPQLSEVNPHIKPLQYYAEGIGLFNAKIRQDMESPRETLTAWRRLKGKQSDAVAGLIDDYANMRYRSDDEIKNKVRRFPTNDEFKKMVADNQVSDAGLQVFRKSLADLDYRLNDLSRILKARAAGIKDDTARQAKLDSIDRGIADMRKAPYFPFLRHGDYTVTVYKPNGDVAHFERFDTARQQKSGAARIAGMAKAGDKVLPGFLAKDVEPLVGLPPQMLDLLGETLKLSDSQKSALPQLKFDHSPEQSFLHRLAAKNYTPGYSKDFLRSYANYWFHSSRYFARAEWSDRFRGWIQETRALRYDRSDATKIDQIANFMGKHLDYVMSPKADFAALRGLIFNLRLGFSPTTATLYLTQTPLGTYPWLASAFGDVKAIAAMSRASARLANYYKSKSVESMTDPQLKGLAEAHRQGVLVGGAAPELAGISEGRNLTGGFGKGLASQAWVKYQELAGSLLHASDSWNRRVAFDSGWQLAMENPDARYIQRARERNPMEYQRLLSEGWSPQEASAFVVGKHTVESTHFVYQRSHRPQIMQGKASALLMFKFWQQNMLFTLWNYPSVAARSLLVMGAMGGMMGLPFAQDFNGVLKAIGWKLFGKDWDLDRETRQFITDHFGNPGRELADSLLHGLSRNGMGIPSVLEGLGHLVGAKIPFPSTDRSGAIGLGDVLPVNMGGLLGPNKDLNSVIARQAQSASGAAFGFFFDVYKLLEDSQLDWNDAKRWEGVAPHWLANASKAFRWYSEGRERDRGGNTVARFDPNDTTQMMEILARALGYNPTRLSQQYDRNEAAREVESFWDLRHEGLMRQAWEAKKSGDKDEYQRVVGAIRNYNSQLPDDARGKAISGDQLRQYFEKRARTQAEIEQGISPNRKNVPIMQSIQKLYPEAQSVGKQRLPQIPQALGGG